MKLYDSGRAPNPRRARIFLAEKGISVPTEQVDMMAMAHKTPEYTAINPLQRMPALVLDDGTVITELIAICRYFEALQPQPPLFGVGAKEIALVEMWNRRCELNLLFGVAHIFRHTHPAMKELEVPQVPAWAEANRPRVADFLDHTRRAIEVAQVHRRRSLFRRRHHRAGRDRLHEAGEDPGAGRSRQSEPLARGRVGAAEREGIKPDARQNCRLRRRVRLGRPDQYMLLAGNGEGHVDRRFRRVGFAGAEGA